MHWVQQGIGKRTAEVQNSTLVILINFCTKIELTFFKAVPSPIPKTLGEIIQNVQQYKIIIIFDE